MGDSAWIAMISAGAALAGVALSQAIAMLQAHLARQNARHVLLRTKYEELAGHVTDSMTWSQALLDRHTARAAGSPASAEASLPLAARRAYVLALLYFPRLTAAADRHMQAAMHVGLSFDAAVTNQEPTALLELTHWTVEMGTSRAALDGLIASCAVEYTKA